MPTPWLRSTHMRISWLVVPALISCGDNKAATPADGPAVSIDAHVTTVTETGTAVDQVSGMPIEGATVCAYGIPGAPCATTDITGAYSLPVAFPDGKTQIAVVTSADGYLGRENDLAEDSSVDFFWETIHGLYATDDAAALLGSDAGFGYPGVDVGYIEIMAFPASDQGNTPSVTATISPTAPAPVYGGSDANLTPDPALTATPGNAETAAVYFGNVAPGTYQVTVQDANGICTSVVTSGMVTGTVNGEWPPTGSASVSAGVHAGVLTVGISVECP
jgi:hypothetical protein